MNTGFIYYSVGKECNREALLSVASLLKHMPGANVTIFTDKPSEFKRVGAKTSTVPSGYNKVQRIAVMEQSPYKKTFYIDSDTLFISDCQEMFDYLNDDDLCLALSNLVDTNANIPKTYPFYNSGVIGYQLTNSTKLIFKLWAKQLSKHLAANKNTKDEPLLRQVLYSQNAAVNILPRVYNFRADLANAPSDLSNIKLIHAHGDLIGYCQATYLTRRIGNTKIAPIKANIAAAVNNET